MDYEKEFCNLNEKGNAWKPELGVHKIVILGEPEETEYVDEKENVTPQIKLLVSVDKTEKDWYVGKGKTYASLYGQLITLGKHWGSLTGKTITLLVNKQSEKKKSYMITEATEVLQLINAQTEGVQ